MNKKYIKVGILSILSLAVLYFAIFAIQNYTLEESLVNDYNEGKLVTDIKDRSYFVRCNLNIFEPEFASVFFIKDEGNIGFRKTKMFSQNEQEWKNSRTGGTIIKNTTFPQLLKMVKEDCSQFQKKHYESDEKIRWSYMPKLEEKIKTKEEIEQERLEEEEWDRKVESGEIKIDTRTIEEIKADRKKEREVK